MPNELSRISLIAVLTGLDGIKKLKEFQRMDLAGELSRAPGCATPTAPPSNRFLSSLKNFTAVSTATSLSPCNSYTIIIFMIWSTVGGAKARS